MTIKNELPPSVLVKSQFKTYGPKSFTKDGRKYRITANVRYDDQCGNGHNSFSITGSIDRLDNGRWQDDVSGCIHQEIELRFPELAPFIKWHLMGSDGPMHYLANVVYHAGNRDCHGCLKGEPWSWDLVIRWANFPISYWSQHSRFIKWCGEVGPKVVGDSEVLSIGHPKDSASGHKFVLGGFPCTRWHECPFDSEREALEFVAAAKLGFTLEKVPVQFGEGKARDFESARSSAVWPDATDKQLMMEPPELRALLMARLPALMAEFKAAVESLGFTY